MCEKKSKPAQAKIVLSTSITFEGHTQRFLVFNPSGKFFEVQFDVTRPICDVVNDWMKSEGLSTIVGDGSIRTFAGRKRDRYVQVDLPMMNVRESFPSGTYYHVDVSNLEVDLQLAKEFMHEKEEVGRAFPLLQPLVDFLAPLSGLLSMSTAAAE